MRLSSNGPTDTSTRHGVSGSGFPAHFFLIALLFTPTSALAQSTIRVSVDSQGVEGNASSDAPTMSGSGRYVAFHSDATNLVAGDANGQRDIFLRDVQASTTTRVSIGLAGQEPNGPSQFPSLSRDGRFLAFASTASNLTVGDSNGVEDVFKVDLTTGQIWRYSNTLAVAALRNPLLSDDGSYVVAVAETATGSSRVVRIGGGYLYGPSNYGPTSIAGDGSAVATVLGFGSGVYFFGPPASEYQSYGWPPAAISPDGEYFAYGDQFYLRWVRLDGSSSGNIVPGPWNIEQVVLSDHGEFAIYGTRSFRIRSNLSGLSRTLFSGNGRPEMSADTRLIAYASSSNAIVPGDTNNCSDVFLADWYLTVYADADADGHGAVGAPPVRQAMLMPGWSITNDDCDDTHPQVHPGAPELCDGLDNDCDGVIDNGPTILCWIDADADGYGDPLAAPVLLSCPAPPFVTNNLDCDDSRGFVHPGAPELCDGLDNDCDGAIDEDFIASYCTAGTTVAGCVPAVRGEGAPSSVATSGFDLVVDNVPTQKMGLIFYGLSSIPQPQPWALGSSSYLCIFYPVNRTGAHNSGGSIGTCDGELRVDWNAWRSSNPAAIGSPFSAGQVLYAQGWFRDSGAAKGTNLSDGLMFTLCD